MARKNREFWESARLNNATFRLYYNRLTELAITMFDWKNLPEEIDPRFMELVLFTDGQCVFFKDKDMGKDGTYLALQNILGGNFNVYHIPKRRRAFAVNGYQKNLNEDDSVIIWNNYLHTPSTYDIAIFAQKLYELDRTIDVNAKAQKTPVLIKCDEKQKLTMTNLYMKYDGNQPFIFGDKDLNVNGITVLKTDAPYVSDKLYTLKTQIWNEALTYLGISNVNFQKKERLISDEVMRGMGGVIASRYSRLQARREAAEKINKMFGLDIQVDYRDDFRELDDEFVIEGETGENKITPAVIDLRTRSGGGGVE